jgi:serine/threonine protein kinase
MYIRQLQSEIRIHRALHHKNVVQFDSYFQDTKHAFIILELCHHNVSQHRRVFTVVLILVAQNSLWRN